jgi:hypothetical protein
MSSSLYGDETVGCDGSWNNSLDDPQPVPKVIRQMRELLHADSVDPGFRLEERGKGGDIRIHSSRTYILHITEK